MEERMWQVGKVQVVLGKSSRFLKILVIVLIAVSTLALAALAWAESDIRSRTADMRQEAAEYQYRNAQLQSRVEDLNTIEGMKRIAEEELGMVTPDSVIIEAQVK